MEFCMSLSRSSLLIKENLCLLITCPIVQNSRDRDQYYTPCNTFVKLLNSRVDLTLICDISHEYPWILY
jgi:hypothetical protein